MSFKTSAVFGVFCAFFSSHFNVSANESIIKTPTKIAVISHKHLRAIDAAIPVLLTKKLKWWYYDIKISETDTSFELWYSNPKSAPERLGQDPMTRDNPDFEVEVDKKTYNIIRYNYVK